MTYIKYISDYYGEDVVCLFLLTVCGFGNKRVISISLTWPKVGSRGICALVPFLFRAFLEYSLLH